MNENVKELNTAIAILAQLSVSGDAVDMMAAAKQKIRKVVADLENQETEETNE